RDGAAITLRQLMTHTSGLPRLGAFDYTRADREPSERDVVKSLDGFALENPPGTKFVYSNLGFALLGIAAAHADRAPYRELIERRIFAPLGMRSSKFDRGGVDDRRLATAYKKDKGKLTPATHWRLGASEAAGAIYSTLRDMGRYVAMELGAYPPRDAPEQLP